jgi:NADH dehydrogenase [ubiquinone] 1 alpha subcomplex assembly factor 6
MLSLPSSDLSHAASHLGVAQTFSTLLRALPFHASKGRIIIPAEITAKHRVSQEEVRRKGSVANGIEDAVFEFATIANDHMITARDMFKHGGSISRTAMPIFLAGVCIVCCGGNISDLHFGPQVPVTSFLGRLEAVNFKAFHPSLRVRDWKLPWRVWRSYYKGSF